MSNFSDLKAVQMYVANNEQPGFWIRRTTWGNTCAQVTSVGPFTGLPPYYGNPVVLADIYELRTSALNEKDAKISLPVRTRHCGSLFLPAGPAIVEQELAALLGRWLVTAERRT